MGAKKIGKRIITFIVTIICIYLSVGAYLTSNGASMIGKLALILIIWIFSLRKTVNLNGVWNLLKMKEKINLNMMVFWIIIIAAATTFISGRVYNQVYSAQIAAREQHLIAAAQALTPPQNAMRDREDLLRKAFVRMYFIDYSCESSVEEMMRHYYRELKQQGYKIDVVGKKEIKASKAGMTAGIRCEKDKVFLHFEFDDIFQKLNI